MGTLVKRRRKDGSTAWLAQISIMRDRKMVWRESKTFDRRSAAAAWIEAREELLSSPGALDQLGKKETARVVPTVGDAINRYMAESRKSMGRTKTQVLKTILNFDIAEKPCNAITSVDVVKFAQQKLDTGVRPQTVSSYMSHLGSVFSIAKPAWNYPIDPQSMEEAWKVTDRLGITGKSKERERRPTLAELDRLMEHFSERSRRRPSCVPMSRVLAFALYSTRRQEEIVRLTWSDLDFAGSRVLVRDMKNPAGAGGNHVWCDLPPQALNIIRGMPKSQDRIFPYSTDAVSAAFTRACRFLEIEDLHFHDLRHEGISRLFEMGLGIPHVSAVSGHRSWTSLKRYTHLRQLGDKYANWKWLPEVTAPMAGLNRRAR